MAEENKETLENEETKNDIDFEKIVADLKKDVESLHAENDKLKTSLSKANSENAERKRREQERMTEDERKEAERAEESKAIMDELNALREKDRISTYTTKLVASGYDVEAAQKMASALPEGISDDFFSEQKTFIEKTIADTKAEALKQQPSINPGNSIKSKEMSKEDFDKLGYTARAKLKAENPDLYKKLSS